MNNEYQSFCSLNSAIICRIAVFCSVIGKDGQSIFFWFSFLFKKKKKN